MCREVAALEEFHNDERSAVRGDAVVEHLDDVGALHIRACRRLAREAKDALPVRSQLDVHELNDDLRQSRATSRRPRLIPRYVARA